MHIRTTFASLVLVVAICILLVFSCKKEDGVMSSATTPMAFVVPASFPQPIYNFAANPITEQGFALGRKLFYDGRLSKDGNFPCASCHQSFAAFATYDHNLSHGFDNQFTTRNAPGLFNLAWVKEFNWDGGVNNLDVQPLIPLTAHNEMAEDVNSVLAKLSQDKEYVQMFAAAFGSNNITAKTMLQALSQFMLQLVSGNSKYDLVKKQQASFTIYEQSGYEIFQAKCASCHREPLFTDQQYHNTGFAVDPYLKDMGRMTITHIKSDSLKFKTPSLRNVMLTAPYLHDGRFWSIDQVLDHYQSGSINSVTLDTTLRNGISLTYLEKRDLKAFFYALSDTSFTKNRMFAQP